MQSNWDGSWALVEILIECGFSGSTRQYRRNQALTLLAALFRNQILQETAPPKLKDRSIAALCGKVVSEFNIVVEGGGGSSEAGQTASPVIKPRFLCELLNLTHAMYLAGAHTDKSWGDIVDVLNKLRNCIPKNRHFHDVKKAYNKVCAPLKIKVVQGCEKR